MPFVCLKCFAGALLHYSVSAFLSLTLSSEANLLSITDSDGPFSLSEERKVSTVYLMVKMCL